ncbi:hypothetical protein HDU78_003086 [Chytriomyces hyalinus]|nr:hypothetical protein HDU78_003086 [Chytriomyces hyalinus]
MLTPLTAVLAFRIWTLLALQVAAQSQARQTREVRKYYSQPNCNGDVTGFEFADATPSTCVATETCRNSEYTVECFNAVFNDLPDYTSRAVNGQQFAQVKIWSRASCDYFSKMFHFRTNSCIRMTDPGEARSMRIDYAEGNLQMVRRRFSDAGCLSELAGARSVLDLRIRDCSEPISPYNAYDSVDIFPLPSDPVVSAVLKGQPVPVTTASAPRTTSAHISSSEVAVTSTRVVAPATTTTTVSLSPSTTAVSSTTASSSSLATTTSTVAKSEGAIVFTGDSLVSSPGNSVAAIAGGVAGGIAVFAAVIFGLVLCKRRRNDTMQTVPTAEGDFFQPHAAGKPRPQDTANGDFFQRPAAGKPGPQGFEIHDIVVGRTVPETAVPTQVQAIYPAHETFPQQPIHVPRRAVPETTVPTQGQAIYSAHETFSQQPVHVPMGQGQHHNAYSPVPSSFMTARSSEYSEKRNLVDNLSVRVGGTSVTTMLADPGPLPSKVDYYSEEKKEAAAFNLGAGPAPVFDDDVPAEEKDKTALFDGLELPADPLQWTVEHVTEWMCVVSDANIALNALENDISGTALLLLRTEDLEKLGLTGIGPRLRVERAIAGLNSRSQGISELFSGQVVNASGGDAPPSFQSIYPVRPAE